MMGISGFFWAFLFLQLILRSCILSSHVSACNSNDLVALNDFSSCFTTSVDGWNSSFTDCCSWPGLTCDNSSALNRRIVGLDLSNYKLEGRVCDSVADLNKLRFLNFTNNYLTGLLPAKLFQLQHLEIIDLSKNDFLGAIPNGTHLPSIKHIDISYNKLNESGDFSFCTTSPYIQEINLEYNNISGEIPSSLANCKSLRRLFLGQNYLVGDPEESLFQLQNLEVLSLELNSLTGKLNDGIGNLSNLVELYISNNLFSGVLPDIFAKLQNLESFDGSSNNFTGSLPASLVNSPCIVNLDLRNNSLNGQFSFNCSAMVNLTYLYLGKNKFRGPIPESISFCQSLKTLSLGFNNLGGKLPINLKNLQNLESVAFGSSELVNISAALDTLSQCKNLSTIILTENFKDEEMPGDMNFQFRNVKVLIIPFCGLRGSFPQWLRHSSMLQLLDLSWNHLTGTIPADLHKFNLLFYIDLSNNSFTGNIPQELTGLRGLVDDIPIDLTPSGLLFFKYTGRDPAKYKQVFSFPPTLDLSYNQLNGTIWPSFGNLRRLHVLNLKQNHLSGSIPENLSGMTSLEVLDLSHNEISGHIPSTLSRLNFLSTFNVSYNLLEGEIPSGGQFSTFPNSSFEGNKGLCGAYTNPCQLAQLPHPQRQPPPQVESFADQTGVFGLQIYLGAGTGFLLTVAYCFFSGWVIPKV